MKIDLEAMQFLADDASELLKLLANRHRLLIMCVLMEGEKSVGQLVGLVGARDSTVSQNLALLRRCGLISGRREGQTIFYRLENSPARGVLESLCKSLCEPARLSPGRRMSPAPGPWNAALLRV